MSRMASAIKITDILVLHGGKEYTFKVPEAITQAKTLDGLAVNTKEVLALALQPLPSKIKRKIEPKKS